MEKKKKRSKIWFVLIGILILFCIVGTYLNYGISDGKDKLDTTKNLDTKQNLTEGNANQQLADNLTKLITPIMVVSIGIVTIATVISIIFRRNGLTQ